ncbi:hypothetical protein [Spirosoma endbachense]|uniref:TonB-dependent receptor plug domain-containing protein n=1 Tax=Spirosoma endbachense TaxID=2666025 RepID=A0A6P1VQX5_9BACT|nr:hypothetical protein [Spirosoma endbachense]QHV93999.1 hypothetical protein GJR95_02700 [Spirosoma endbachense]
MQLKDTVLAALIGCFAFSFWGCSKISNGIPPAPTVNKFLKGADGPPLWLVDNVEVVNPQEKGSFQVSPNDIQSITVLSPASNSDLISRFGLKGKNGVVLVATKKAGN